MEISREICDNVDKNSSVRVAIRIRPQNSKEKINMCRICAITTPGEPHLVLGSDKAFTFDYVFNMGCQQTDVYTSCVEQLVDNALSGFNATVLAYGQTGSGKTYTMGTGFDCENYEQLGIIPRALHHIFSKITEIQNLESHHNETIQPTTVYFSVAVQFLELYNEDVIDLLDPFNNDKVLKIHEDAHGQINVSGLAVRPVHSPQEALTYLRQGALARTTASTQMNEQSSRSHALFTILIRRQRTITCIQEDNNVDTEILTSKFNFVDLAGSERLNRTGATGERAREGISINSGLLCLGNCISALGDKSKRATHVPYRDSKLTRLLQDSLGGNSLTVMIACISPSDRDFMETLNTLKYANRARNIKNKVQINQDQTSRTIAQLRREVADLQLELLDYKQGKRIVDSEGQCSISDIYHENMLLECNQMRLKQRMKILQETINCLTEENAKYKTVIDSNNWASDDVSDSFISSLISGYVREIEELKAKLIESNRSHQHLKTGMKMDRTNVNALNQKNNIVDAEDLILIAKEDIKRERDLMLTKSLTNTNTSVINKKLSDENENCNVDLNDKATELQEDLNFINADIEIKTKLIEELERSQQRIQIMRNHYEEKLNILNYKISNTQQERDEILEKMGQETGLHSKNELKSVREEYEKKLLEMKGELKKLHQAQKEHTRRSREIQMQATQLENLRKQISNLKCLKVQLLRQMKQQSIRYKEEDVLKSREIAKLKKQHQKQLGAFESLKSQMQAKEHILKRKTEEVSALRKYKQMLANKASGRNRDMTASNFIESHSTVQLWSSFSRTISHFALNKQVLLQLEEEMERLVCERECLSQTLISNQKLQQEDSNIDLINEEEDIKSNLNFIPENISRIQNSIMEFEEGTNCKKYAVKNIQTLIDNVCTVDEAKFLLDRLCKTAIVSLSNSHFHQNRVMELQTLLKESQQDNSIQQQLLHHLLVQNDTIKISDFFESINHTSKENVMLCNISGSQNSLCSNRTFNISSERINTNLNTLPGDFKGHSPSPTGERISNSNSEKIRKRTAKAQDLLFGGKEID